MKFTIAIMSVVVVGIASASSINDRALSMFEESFTNFIATRSEGDFHRNLFSIHRHNDQLGRRELRTEAECDAATEELYTSNEPLATATLEYAANLLVALLSFDPNSDCVITGTTFTCEVGTITGESEARSLCTSAGGSVYESSGDVECDVVIEGTSAKIQIDLPTVVTCLPTTSNGTAIDCSGFVPALFEPSDLQDIENGLLSSGFTSASCRTGELSDPNSGGSGSIRFTGDLMALAGTAFVYLLA